MFENPSVKGITLMSFLLVAVSLSFMVALEGEADKQQFAEKINLEFEATVEQETILIENTNRENINLDGIRVQVNSDQYELNKETRIEKESLNDGDEIKIIDNKNKITISEWRYQDGKLILTEINNVKRTIQQ